MKFLLLILEWLFQKKFHPDGKHEFEVAALNYIGKHAFMDTDPAKITFIVDRTPPVLQLKYDKSQGEVLFNAEDNITSQKQIKFSWSIDDGKFTPWVSERRLDVSYLKKGLHKVIVRAEDEAGNSIEKGIVVETSGNKSFGCSNIPVNDFSIMLFLFLISFVGVRILFTAKEKQIN